MRGGRSCRALTVTVRILAIFGEKREGALEGSEQNDTGQLRLSQEPSGSIRLGSNVPDTAPGLPRGDTTLVLNPAVGSFSRKLIEPLLGGRQRWGPGDTETVSLCPVLSNLIRRTHQ